jgi:integrase
LGHGEASDLSVAQAAVLLGLNGLRVSEARDTKIEDIDMEHGHRVLHIVGKGYKPAFIALVPRTARTIDLAIGEAGKVPSWFARMGAISIGGSPIDGCGRWQAGRARLGAPQMLGAGFLGGLQRRRPMAA